MTDRPIVPRGQARRDIELAVDDYVSIADVPTALGFVDALESALRMIARHPSAGSPRYGHELDLPGLRSQALRRYPYLVFYMERRDHIDVWRVLHAQRDIPARLQEQDQQPA